MIHYQLRCSEAHEFDGWFKNSAAFEAQAQQGQLECPACASTVVTRALMAPALARGSAPAGRAQEEAPLAASVPSPPEGAVAAAAKPLPDQMRAMLQKLRARIEEGCDYVGEDFANEARRIHHGEAETRGIYGETSPEQAEALADEGIAVASIPWLPRADG